MPSYAKRTIVCNCCGKKFEAKLLKSFFSEHPLDLDLNPHHPAAYDRVTMCPQCGYSSSNMNVAVSKDIKRIVNSEKYKDVLANPFFDEATKKLLLAGHISAKKSDYLDAAYCYLMAMWHFSELNSDKVTNARGKAIAYFSKYLSRSRDDELALVLVDLLRQSSRFEEAAETAISLKEYLLSDSFEMRVLRFENSLIEKKDSSSHSVREVLV